MYRVNFKTNKFNGKLTMNGKDQIGKRKMNTKNIKLTLEPCHCSEHHVDHLMGHVVNWNHRNNHRDDRANFVAVRFSYCGAYFLGHCKFGLVCNY